MQKKINVGGVTIQFKLYDKDTAIKNSMLLIQKQTSSSMEQNKETNVRSSN